MITHDGFRMKKCFLEGENVIVDGESYPVISIKETKSYKLQRTSVFLIIMALTVFLFYAGYMGIQDDIINNQNTTDRIVKSIFWLFIFSLFVSLWWAVVKYCYKDISNCRSFWVINGKGVFVEENDDIGIENKLRDIVFKSRYYGGKFTKVGTTGISNKKVKWGLWIIVYVLIFCILSLGMIDYIREDVFILLLLLAFALVFILRFYELKKDYDSLKWKK